MEASRNQGHGSYLAEQIVITYTQEQGCTGVTVFATEENREYCDFFARRGFTTVKDMDVYLWRLYLYSDGNQEDSIGQNEAF
jgi:hypothetical protein